MIADTLTSVQYIEKGVQTLIFTLQMAKKMLAVQWVLGNGLVIIMAALVFVLPSILKAKAKIEESIRVIPPGWEYSASRVLQFLRVFLIKRWYAWYLFVIIAGYIS